MSYNCDTFKIKKIEDFKIPIASLYKFEDSDWHFDREDHGDGTTTFGNCETEMTGIVEGDVFICKSIDCSGEGSGTVMSEILEPAFRDSQGELVAVLVWEGGDTIQRLIVKDGDVRWEDIEL